MPVIANMDLLRYYRYYRTAWRAHTHCLVRTDYSVPTDFDFKTL